MKAKDLMSADPGFCLSTDTLAKAAGTMTGRDCAFLPVVNEDNKVTGVITARDILLALISRNKRAADIRVGDIAGTDVVAARAGDNIKDVMKLMKKKHIRRLPVCSDDNYLLGVLSIKDIIRAAERDKGLRKRVWKVVDELAKPRSIVLHEISEGR